MRFTTRLTALFLLASGVAFAQDPALRMDQAAVRIDGKAGGSGGTPTGTANRFALFGAGGTLGTTFTRPSDNSPVTVFSLAEAAGRTNEAPWEMYLGGATFDGEWDPVMYFGYNASRAKATEPAFRWVIEGNYKHTQRDIEAYWEYISAGSVVWRPIMFTIDKSAVLPAASGTTVFSGSQFSINAPTNYPIVWTLNPGVAGAAASVVVNGGNGQDQLMRISGGADTTKGAAVSLYGDLCPTDVLVSCLRLDAGHYGTPNAGSGQSAILLRTGATSTERMRVEFGGKIAVNNPGVAAAAQFDVNGDVRAVGVQWVTGTRPTCDSTTRGKVWYVAGGAGAADTFEVCRKDAADAYAWVTLF